MDEYLSVWLLLYRAKPAEVIHLKLCMNIPNISHEDIHVCADSNLIL